MALILPSGPSWAHYSDNLTLGANHIDAGVAVTAAANNTKGSIVTVMSALSHDVEYLRIATRSFSGSAVNSATLIDIMIDYAGGTSWETDPFIPNLLAGFTSSSSVDYETNASGISHWYDLPLWVPAGASLGARAQTAWTSDVTGGVVIQACGGNRNPASWWCGQRVTALGIDTANSIGEMIPTASTPSFGAWTSVGSALATDARAVQAMMQSEGDTSAQNTTLYAQIGTGSTQIGPNLVKATTMYESGAWISTGPIFVDIPSGTQLQARCSRSAGANNNVDIAIYAVH